MEEPLTEELLAELLDAPTPEGYIQAHRFKERRLCDYLVQLLDEKGLVRSKVVGESGVGDTYGYQIFTGLRHPGRDKLLQVLLPMGCTLQEVNRALQAGGHNELYPKNRRDAIIIFCIEHGCTLLRTNEELYRFGEETIC